MTYMRLSKFIGAIVVALAFSAIAVATASAVETLWKWLPGSAKETFKGKSGKATLTSAFESGKKLVGFVCTKSLLLLTDATLKVSSELLEEGSTEGKDATLALLIIHFEGCTSGGLPVNSLGDSSGIILVHVEAHNCMIGAGKFGILLKPLLVHLEIPSIKALIFVRGDVLGQLLGTGLTLTYTLDLNAPGTPPVQEFKKCEGGEEEKLESSLDGGVTYSPSTEDAKEGVLEFDMTKDLNGEEMMEK